MVVPELPGSYHRGFCGRRWLGAGNHLDKHDCILEAKAKEAKDRTHFKGNEYRIVTLVVCIYV